MHDVTLFDIKLMIRLKELTKQDEQTFTEFEKQYKAECGNEKIPFSLNPDNLPFEKFWEKVSALRQEKTCPKGFVPAISYLVMHDGTIVGAINLRYKSNDFILNVAGHIGYGILPGMRGKGYATEALRECLLEARKMGLESVVLTTDLDNVASQRVIAKNCGKFLRQVKDKKIFEIELSDAVSVEQSAMAVVVCKNKILTTRESVYGKIAVSLPKGHVETDESVVDAAIRECFEETNVTVNKKNVAALLTPFEVRFTDHHMRLVLKTIAPVLFVTDQYGSPLSKEERVLSVEYIDINEFMQSCSYENVKKVIAEAKSVLVLENL